MIVLFGKDFGVQFTDSVLLNYTIANAGNYIEDTDRGRNSKLEDVKQVLGTSEDMLLSIGIVRCLSQRLGDVELTL